MDIQKVSLTAKPIRFEAVNSDFTRAKCYVMALGKNRNLSHFTKDAVDDAMPTLGLIPVVAHVIEVDTEDGCKTYVGGHDCEWKLEGQNLYMKDLTIPFGVVVPDTYEYVEVEEDDGETATYLTADVVIWSGRYPEIMETIYSNDVYWSQSMEVIPEKTSRLKEDKTFTDIQKYRYSCLTLLGRDDDPEYNTVPCFPSARVEPYDFSYAASNNFTTEFNEMMDRFKAIFSIESNLERGEKMEEIKNNQTDFDEGSVEQKQPDVNREPTTEVQPEGFVEDIEDIEDGEDGKEPSGDTQPEEDPKPSERSYMKAIEAACRALDDLYHGISGWVFVSDISDTHIVYHIVEYDPKYSRTEKIYRAPYEASGDEDGNLIVTIDLDNAVELVEMLLTKEEAEELKQEREELGKLRVFHEETLALKRKQDLDRIIDTFSDLSDIPEFVELIKSCDDISIEDIEEKCFAIRGRNHKVGLFVNQGKSNNIRIRATKEDADKTQPEPYGGLFINHKVNI